MPSGRCSLSSRFKRSLTAAALICSSTSRRETLRATEPDGLAAFVRSGPASIGAGQEHERARLIEPRPAAQNTILAFRRTRRIAIRGDLVIFLLIPVRGPLPDIPGHVAKAEGV